MSTISSQEIISIIKGEIEDMTLMQDRLMRLVL